MITNADRKKLRKWLGTRYTKRVQAYLIEKKILNKTGNIYSINYICHVFNGRNEDEKIEMAMFDLCEETLEKYRKTSIIRKNKLKKPEVATSGLE